MYDSVYLDVYLESISLCWLFNWPEHNVPAMQLLVDVRVV